MIIIGEDSRGCTDYFESNKFILVKCVDIPQWFGLHDEIRFYEKIF